MKSESDWFHLVDLAADPISYEQIQTKKVKVVCTIGPSSESPEMIRSLIRNGMDVARLNFSHGNPADHSRRLNVLRQSAKKEGKYLGILQDIQGPKIRVGRFKNQQIMLKKGQKFTISTREFLGDENSVSCTYKQLHKDIKVGHRILLDDGLLFLIVEKVKGQDIFTRVIFGGPLKNNKGMNLPDTRVKISCLTIKDKGDLKFGLKNGVDFVALSFVQSAADIVAAKKLIHDTIGKSARAPLIIAKIESALAVNDVENILKVTDGIMIARGDLGVECPMEQVPGLQKQIIRAANKQGKFVITATQMLESMTNKPRPTRAEASDVANAVLDGTDAVMLSAETASGDFPLESVKTMSRIIVRTESYLFQLSDIQEHRLQDHTEQVTAAITAAAVQATKSLDVSAICAFTHSGATGCAISRVRPNLPIFALTPFEDICRRLSVVWGVIPATTKVMKHTDEMPELCKRVLQKYNRWKSNSFIVILSGTPVARPGTTNLLKIHHIKND
ncbi:MAG: pyruvate kinase [Deltaproteobacteria bacterium]|nr:pyruvate kinase [Deltaproteobacteria bacterium]